MCLQVLERLLVLLLLPLLLILPRLITYFNQSNKPSYSLDEVIQKSKNEHAAVSAFHSQTNNDNKHDDIEELLNVSEDECHEGDNDIAMFACVLVSVSCVLKVNQVSELFSTVYKPISPVAQC